MAYTTLDALPANCVIFNDYVIRVGGSALTDSANIQKAKIEGSGALGSWTTIATLPLAVSGVGLALANNSLYMVGGVESDGSGNALARGVKVYKLDLYGDASPMTVAPQVMRDLSAPLMGAQVTYWDNYLIVSGGLTPRNALDYDNQTANFTPGETITGQTSAATMVLGSQSDGGATGTLYASSQTGIFVNNEVLDGSTAGVASADANGGSYVQMQLSTEIYRARISWPSGDLSAWENVGDL